MDGLFGDGLVDVLCCGGDSLEEDLRWGPRLGALVDLVEFEDGVTNGGVALFKIVEAFSRGAFFLFSPVCNRQLLFCRLSQVEGGFVSLFVIE